MVPLAAAVNADISLDTRLRDNGKANYYPAAHKELTFYVQQAFVIKK